jgi:serine/threonine protein kinase
MITTAIINGKKIRIDPNKTLGKGGEADVYDIGGLALKVFKQPDHPDLSGNPLLQAAAQARIDEHQTKLAKFPKNLPAKVNAPIDLAYDTKGKIIGYVSNMIGGAEVLFSFTQPKFRAGVEGSTILDILSDLHETVVGVHNANVVIGDFNDLNILVTSNDYAHIIDADSMQYGNFKCSVYTARFVDPLNCDQKANELRLIKEHSKSSDWYAFAVMVMQCFLCIDPFGGIYKPKDPKKNVPHPVRSLHHISVFNPEVKYPKAAIPFGVLPDDLLHHLQKTFDTNKRLAFPGALLKSMRWTKCTTCSKEHARPICPNCSTVSPVAVKQTIVVRGQVTATRIFQTTGTIIAADYQNGHLRWLYHENQAYYRDGGKKVIDGKLDNTTIRYRIQGDNTLLGKGDTVVSMNDKGLVDKFNVSVANNRPIFDTNSNNVFWVQNGQLMKNEDLNPVIGSVLEGQTHIWVGSSFGFGMYRAGQLCVAFTFSADGHGINDTVKLPKISGKLVNARCTFAKDRCWLFTTSQEGPDLINRCTLIRADGTIEATLESAHGDGSWLGQIRGGVAVGGFLLMPTDEGVVRVEANQGTLAVIKRFPDTEQFIDTNSQLFAATDGLYVVNGNDIFKLLIK